MKKPFRMLVVIVAASALAALVIVFGFRNRSRDHHRVKDATMDPALLESLLTPTASPEVKGTFDQKARDLAFPSPSASSSP
jgi:hypothetical protein